MHKTHVLFFWWWCDFFSHTWEIISALTVRNSVFGGKPLCWVPRAQSLDTKGLFGIIPFECSCIPTGCETMERVWLDIKKYSSAKHSKNNARGNKRAQEIINGPKLFLKLKDLIPSCACWSSTSWVIFAFFLPFFLLLYRGFKLKHYTYTVKSLTIWATTMETMPNNFYTAYTQRNAISAQPNLGTELRKTQKWCQKGPRVRTGFPNQLGNPLFLHRTYVGAKHVWFGTVLWGSYSTIYASLHWPVITPIIERGVNFNFIFFKNSGCLHFFLLFNT